MDTIDWKIKDARAFAIGAHSAMVQKRKYTGEPYWKHCGEVAASVAGGIDPVARPELIAAAWLHDVVEDTGVTLDDISNAFGAEVAALVEMVTDVSKPEDGNRKARKAIDLAHIAAASPDGKAIKLADLISNTKSIAQYDKDFAKIYLPEKRALMAVLNHSSSPYLYAKALEILNTAENSLREATA